MRIHSHQAEKKDNRPDVGSLTVVKFQIDQDSDRAHASAMATAQLNGEVSVNESVGKMTLSSAIKSKGTPTLETSWRPPANFQSTQVWSPKNLDDMVAMQICQSCEGERREKLSLTLQANIKHFELHV